MTEKLLAGSVGLNVLLWIVYSVMDFAGIDGGTINSGIAGLVIAAILFLLYFLSVRHSPRWNYLLLMALLIVLLKTLAEKFSWAEIIVLITHVFTLTLLARKIRNAS